MAVTGASQADIALNRAVINAWMHVSLGNATPLHMQVLLQNPGKLAQVGGVDAARVFHQRLVKAVEEEEARRAVEVARRQADVRAQQPIAQDLIRSYEKALQTVANQAASLASLRAEIESGIISGPKGKAEGSLAAWIDAGTIDGEAQMVRFVQQVNRDSGKKELVAERRAKADVEMVRTKAHFAKAVGLAMAERTGINGRARSALGADVFESAWNLANSNRPDLSTGDTSLRGQAIETVAQAIREGRLNSEGRAENLSDVVESVVSYAGSAEFSANLAAQQSRNSIDISPGLERSGGFQGGYGLAG